MRGARSSILPQVENIGFLMLENRSLDNLLGWLYEGSAPQHVFPDNRPVEHDGLLAGRYSNPDSDGNAVLVYIGGNNWEWAVRPSPYTTSTPAQLGYQARYLVWDAKTRDYKAVAHSDPWKG